MANGDRFEGPYSVTGEVEGTGSAIYVDLDFRPIKITIWNIDGDAKLEWVDSMGDDKGYKIIDDGTSSLIGSAGITPGNGGFSIGADTDVNVCGQTMVFEATRSMHSF